MTKYGGKGTMRKACLKRKCQLLIDSKSVAKSPATVTPKKPAKKTAKPVTPSPQPKPAKKEQKLNVSKSRRWRCGKCDGCKKENCTKCDNCLDMVKYGGFGTKRQACIERKCIEKENEVPSPENTPKKKYQKSNLSDKPKKTPVSQPKKSQASQPKKSVKEPPKMSTPNETPKKRKGRCNECKGCLRDNCGDCTACHNVPQFGGSGTMKMACMKRKCAALTSPPPTPATTPSKKPTKLAPTPSATPSKKPMKLAPTPSATPSKKVPKKPTVLTPGAAASKKVPKKPTVLTPGAAASKKVPKKPTVLTPGATSSKKVPKKPIVATPGATKGKKLTENSKKGKPERRSSSSSEAGFTSSTPIPAKKKVKKVTAKKSKSSKPPIKKKKKKAKPVKPIILKVKWGFAPKSKKTGEKSADATRGEGGDFDFMAEIVTPDDSPGEVNRTKSRTEAQLEDLKNRLDKVNESIERMQAQSKESDASKSGGDDDDEKRVGINARYPISGEELLKCAETDSYLEFFKSIVREERPLESLEMKRHKYMTHEGSVHGRMMHQARVRISRLDFLFDEDGKWEDALRDLIFEKVMAPCGPPPSVLKFKEFDGEWWDTSYGLNYFMHNLYQEAIIKCLQEKFSVSYEKAEHELLRSRYTKRELELVDIQGEMLLKAEEERKEKERKQRLEEERLRQEEEWRRYENSEDEFCVPDIDDDDDKTVGPEPGPSRKRKSPSPNSAPSKKKKA